MKYFAHKRLLQFDGDSCLNLISTHTIPQQQASTPEWSCLSVLTHPNPTAIHVGHGRQCSYCNARLLSEENETFCCREGKVAITPLRPLPEGWERMFQTPAFRYHMLCMNTCIVVFTCTLPYLFRLHKMFQTPAFRYHMLCMSTCIVVFPCTLAYLFRLHIILEMCLHCIVDRGTSSVFSLRGQSRKYNNLFAFTAIGVTGTERFVPQPVPSVVKIHGRTYHRVLPADMRGPVHW